MSPANKYQAFVDADLDELVASLLLPEKVRLLAGEGWWSTFPIKRLGIPAMYMSDGPNGVRGRSHFCSTPAQAIPCETALGSTWNVDTLAQVGKFLAVETLVKGSSLLLAPTTNIQRSPLGGRSFESFAEDPFLSGVLASAYINGLQEQGVGAVIKHFVANDQEHERMAVNSEMDERTLREIYLMPFQIAQRLAKPWSFMTSYGRIDGVHCAENKRLLQRVLREEWGFDGLVMSDWFGTYSVSDAVNAGLDLEMPGPTAWRGTLVQRSLTAGKISPRTIDARVRAILQAVQRSAKAHPEIMEVAEEGTRYDENDKVLNRAFAAESIVLLKNNDNLLPINPVAAKKIAVIGPNAKARVYSGGGSSALNAQYVVTPLEGIKAALPDDTEISFAVGCQSTKLIPLLDGQLTIGPDPSFEVGYSVDFYNGVKGEAGVQVINSTTLTSSRVRFNDTIPDGLDAENFSLTTEGWYTPDEDGVYTFGFAVIGRAKLFVKEKLIIDLWDHQQPGGSAFYGQGSKEEFGDIDLKAGTPVKVVIEYNTQKPASLRLEDLVLMTAALRFGCVKKIEADQAIKDAAAVAADADVAIVIVGTNMDWETEGNDRDSLALPGRIDELVFAVAAANPRVIVVNQSGSAVTMPWADKVPAIVQGWFIGCEMGNAIADVLFGKVNPSGKLPLTFPAREEDIPAYGSFGSENNNVRYSEGLFVGYRWYDKRNIKPLFPFGHGLSYTTFAYSDLQISPARTLLTSDDKMEISFKVTNTGAVAGSESSQVYLTDVISTLTRPQKELKGFSKVHLEPGQSQTVTVSLGRDAVSFWDDDVDAWRIEPGVFKVRVGKSSVAMELEGEFKIKKGGTWKGL